MPCISIDIAHWRAKGAYRDASALRQVLLATLMCIAPFVLSGCLIVKQESAQTEPSVALSPKPPIRMSEEVVHSEPGDMVARLPEDWFFLDVEGKVSSNVIAVAVNPDYTLSLVFSVLRKDDVLDEVFSKEGLLGLARASYQKHERKTAGTIKRIGQVDIRNVGVREFGTYRFSNDNGATVTRVSVFKSSLDNYYECALIPLPDTAGRLLPGRENVENIFSAVLSTIVY